MWRAFGETGMMSAEWDGEMQVLRLDRCGDLAQDDDLVISGLKTSLRG